MTEENKIETQTKSFRLPIDVIETLERWAEDGKQTVTQVLATCVRVAAEDEKCIAGVVKTGNSVLQDGEVGVGVLQIRSPRNRDELADAITVLMAESSERIGDRDRISALGVARARVYKLTPEYRAARSKEPYSVYDDEKALAEKLSETGGAGDTSRMREKGEGRK